MTSFSRIITLLRKEQSLSQKSAAAALGISQALLSHYEKGIRECGLDFVVKTADFYHVSTDYLLGRTMIRSGNTISVEELPETEPTAPKSSTTLPILQKKLLFGSLQILYAILGEMENRQLTAEVSTVLSATVYHVFRMLYSANGKNPQGMFSISPRQYSGLCQALSAICHTNARDLATVDPHSKHSTTKTVALSPELLSERFPLFSTALFHLIQTTEERMEMLKQQETA